MTRIGRRKGWDISLTGFDHKDVGITKEQAQLFSQMLGWRSKDSSGKPVINFILIYSGTEELTLTEFASTPVGTEIRTPNIDGVHSYYHKKESSPAVVEDWDTISSGGSSSGSYKVYTALLNQWETEDPTAIILENTIGDIVWTRVNTGHYRATLNNAFPDSKTVVFASDTYKILFTPPNDFSYILYLVTTRGGTGESSRDIAVFDVAGSPIDLQNQTANLSIEIRVYP